VISLRPYQDQCIAGLRGAFAAGYHSPLLVSPTGSGKTVMFSYLTGKLLGAGKRVALLCHREELVDQISRTLTEFDVRHGLITSGALYDRRLMAHVASVATLIRRLERVAVPDYVIMDEAHHGILASTWGKIIAFWRGKNPALRLIGVTATPERLSGEGLGEVFDEMVLGPTTRELMDLGSLCDYRLFAAHHTAYLSAIGKQAGEFKKGESADVMMKPEIVGDTVEEYRRLLNGAPTISFEVSIKNAEAMAERFRGAGYRSMCLDGKMDKTLRRDVVRDFSRGQINVLTSCDIVSEGFDVPGIVGGILRRPTWSLALYLQQAGRTFRTAPGKGEAILVDQVGNSARHGLPCDPRTWSLTGREERRGKKSDEENVACRQCEKCYAVSPAAASKCRECGAPFPVKARKIEEVAGQLSEVEVAKMRRQSAREQAAARTLEDLIQIGIERGMRNPHGWASHVHAARLAKEARG
jgi:superfamily II DNA or RNA helicase